MSHTILSSSSFHGLVVWDWGLWTDRVFSLSPGLAQQTPNNNNNNKAADGDAFYAILEEIVLTQHECVIMGDFILPHIDSSLQLPTPAPGNKLRQFIENNGVSKHVQEPNRQNNILDLVITTEEALLVTLQMKTKFEIIKQSNFHFK